MCVSVPLKRKTTIIQVNQEAGFFFYFSYSFSGKQTHPEDLTTTWTIKRTPSSSKWGLGLSSCSVSFVKHTFLCQAGTSLWVFRAWEVRSRHISLSLSVLFSTGQRGWSCWRAGWVLVPLAERRLVAPASERWRCWDARGARWTESWWRRMEWR